MDYQVQEGGDVANTIPVKRSPREGTDGQANRMPAHGLSPTSLIAAFVALPILMFTAKIAQLLSTSSGTKYWPSSVSTNAQPDPLR